VALLGLVAGGSLVDPQGGDPEDGGRLAVLEGRMRALELENKYLRTKSLKTCEELRNSPYNETGTYTLDPDGSGAPVELHCDMEKGVTEVGHDHMGAQNVTWCRDAGCFNLSLTYDVPMEQVQALIAMSDTCEQQITFECKLAPLKNAAFGVKYGWWTNQRGEKKFFFDGGDEESEVCSMATNEGVCNCDISLVPLWNSDTGKITAKASLPIKEFHYGGFFSEHQAARVSIGKLACSGKSQDPPDLLSTCSSLKKSGASSNGFYLTKTSPEEPVGVSYCQLSSPGYREETLRRGQPGTLGAKTEEFNVTSYQTGNGANAHLWNGNIGMYDVRSMNISPNSSSSFDADGTCLTAKKSGLFAVSSSDFYIFQDNFMISVGLKAVGMVQLVKGEKLKFKSPSSRQTSRIRKILITEMN